MRRTYRSKKDAGGALDPRDVVLNLDEKSSAFDAFYIQNIKQTKRELSYVAASNVNTLASNKVRKRKYVKRIVKEMEPVRQRETMSTSTYLTPDKSIRVNKVLDTFDMLLNSSPAGQEQPKTVKNDSFDKLLPKRECKTYKRRIVRKVNKYNYSSSDSHSTESDKENTSQSQSNVTDIGAHELIIEKEPIAHNSPQYLDESIKKIVNNISLFNNLKHKGSNVAVNTSYKNIERLTRNSCQNSPILQRSPLCSTPFKDKYRGMSIYKFSPIPQKEQGISPNLIPLQEKDENNSNASIVYVGTDHSKLLQNNQAFPVTHLPDEIIKNKIEMSHENEAIEDNKDSNQNVTTEVAVIGDEIKYISQSLSSVKNSFQNTHEEPFLGFAKHTNDIVTSKIDILQCLEDNKSLRNESNLIENDLESRNNDMNDSYNASIISESSYQANTSHSSANSDSFERESLYDTCNSEQSSSLDGSRDNREPVVAIERLSDSVFMKYYKQMQIDSQDVNAKTDDEYESLANDSREELETNMSTTESNFVGTKPNAIVITDSSTTEDMVSDDMALDKESESYDKAEANDNEDDKYISFVTTRRRYDILKDSMYILDNSCCSSSTDCDKTVRSNVNVNLEKSELNISENTTNSLDIFETKDAVEEESKLSNSPEKAVSNETITRRSKTLRHSNSIRLDLINVAGKKPEKRISRKSLRRSMKSQNQNDSSSTESDSTKIGMTLRELEEEEQRRINMNEDNKSIIDNSEQKLDSDTQKNYESPRLTTYDLRKNTVMNNLERLSCTGLESKSCIVLEPGKKWERSLSIYRRMTMVADHFDETILEDECRIKKGRKYRQSVIHTMEMQELRDSLHNDSINIRRSTFVSKPSRPTIRFVIDNNISRVSLSTSSVFDDLKGFLNEECDDTVIELSKLSIADSEHEVTILDNFHESERVTTARDYVLRRCNQAEPVLFDECYPETVLKNCRKIGEGVYGEVFLWRGRDGRARVMKIVPIAGTLKVNGEDQKDFHEIISEIVIAMELSALRAPIADIERQLDEGNDIHALDLHAIENATDVFNEVLAVRCVFGPYPSRLLDLWDLYDECKGSENDNPAVLPSDQQYIVLELANAGQDLESFQFTGAQQAHTLFQQLALGLAVAEEAFQFEHRDLHWGNVLIAPTEQKLATFVLRGRTYRVPRGGVAATIIDYSLSRLTLPLQADSAALYNDLATDEQLFDAVGDYQFEVYRLMRDKVGNDWKNFEPYTNILWLHYTVDKMITALRYKRTNTKIHKHYIEKLKGIKDRILEYGSSVQYVLTDIEF